MLHNRIYLGEIAHKGKSYPGQQAAIIDRELRDQVQARFELNLQAPRKRPRTTSRSLLTGLLLDDKGNRFTPSHSAKKGRRYRYYVSQAVIRKKSDAVAISRPPAQDTEELVLSKLQSLLGSPQRLLHLLGDCSRPSEIESIVEASREWATASKDRVRPVLLSIVTRVTIREDAMELQFSKYKLRELLLPGQEITCEEETVSMHDEVELQRHRGEVRLVLPADPASQKSGRNRH